MRLLLDTQVVIWLGVNSGRVPPPTLETLGDPRNDLFVSSISVWEIAAKYALGKLPIPVPPATFAERILVDFIAKPLAFEARHAELVVDLPLLHKDPFDRMLICQALEEGMTLVTADTEIRRYNVPTLW